MPARRRAPQGGRLSELQYPEATLWAKFELHSSKPRQRSHEKFNRSRPAEQIPLEGAAALMDKEVALLRGFHALGNDRQAQAQDS